MSRHDDRYQQKDAEKPEAGQQDRLGEDDKESVLVAEADGPLLMDTVSDPAVDTDLGEEIEEKSEPFDGNNASGYGIPPVKSARTLVGLK